MTVPLAVQAVATDDAARFGRLIGPYLQEAYRLAAFVLQDGHEAEDALQDAALKAWRRQSSLRDAEAARRWFLTIVSNECRTRLRRPWWRVLRSEHVPSNASPDRDLESAVDLDRAMRALRPEDRLLLHLRYRQDLPTSEVARLLGIREGACRVRLHRVLKALRPAVEIDAELLA